MEKYAIDTIKHLDRLMAGKECNEAKTIHLFKECLSDYNQYF